jgi:hypothetical protein
MKNRQQWAAMLAKLVAPMDATRAAKALADMLPMLADFPDAAFCLDSLDAVATKCRFAPSYAELRGHLADWWKAHRPPLHAIETDQSASAVQAGRDREDRESWEGITAAQVRAKVRALEGIIAPGWRGILAHALAKNAPHHLGLIPPEWLKDVAEPPERAKLRAAAAEINAQVRRGPTDAA